MSAVGKAIGGIGKAVGSVTGSLFGNGNQITSINKNVAPMSAEEQALLKKLLGTAGEQSQTSDIQLSDKDKQIHDLFKTNISNFLSRKADGSVDPNALKSATAFVDQTFTTPAEEQLKLAQSDYLAQAGAQQAALGRGVQDSAFQENLFKSLANQRAQLGSQRGQLISDQVLNQPGRDIQTGLQGLSGLEAIQQQRAFAPTFLNQLNQQAFQNRVSLLNNLSNQRLASAGLTQTQQGPNTGLLGGLTQLGQFAGGIAGLGGLGGIASAIPGKVGGFLGVSNNAASSVPAAGQLPVPGSIDANNKFWGIQ